MITETTIKLIKLGTNESMMFICEAHLTTITGEGDYPAGWYRICTLQTGIETVLSRVVQNMHSAGWYRN